MSDSGPLLEIRNLRKSFADLTVLSGIDLAIEERTVTTLIGKSGSGKTVLLKCIAGLLVPDDGEILFEGKRLNGHAARDAGARARWAEKMSYLFQGDALFGSLTAWENVALPLREGPPMPRKMLHDRVEQLFAKLDLVAIESKYPAELSGGMRRRVALARALVTEPKIVLFDEPTSGLDPIRRNAVLEMILKDREQFGFTALVVSHDVPESLYISDQVALLENGRLAVKGRPWDLPAEAVNSSDGRPFLENEQDLIHRVAGIGTRSELEETFPSFHSAFDTLALVTFLETSEHSGMAADLALPSLVRQFVIALEQRSQNTSRLFGVSKRDYLFALNERDRPSWENNAVDDGHQAPAGLQRTSTAASANLSIRFGSLRPDATVSSAWNELNRVPQLFFRCHDAAPSLASTIAIHA